MKNVHALQENIFITSDDEIKYGDWMIRDNEQPIKSKKVFFWDLKDGYYKIILTTDQDLIKDGVQPIDDEFLEWFVKNSSCEEIEVTEYLDSGFSYGYKIIIPKEETKKETLEKVWEQTMHLRFFLKRKNGCKSENVLQQLFISNLGNKEWTDVPSFKY